VTKIIEVMFAVNGSNCLASFNFLTRLFDRKGIWPIKICDIFRLTLRQSHPNKAGLKCPSVRLCMHTYAHMHMRMFVHPQKVSSISMKLACK